MRYHSFNSTGSSLFPKLSGSYENELHPMIAKLFVNAYDQVIDIGCAEGYYAVGAALKFKNVPVFAFDLDAVAREQCAAMAQVNNVKSQVKILAQCTATWLYENCMNKHNLIICDCEGCERQLFGYQNIAAFSNSDLIVELHPMYHRDVRKFLYNLFFTTHEIYYVSSYDDNRKIFELPEEYDFMTGLDKLKLVQEGRRFSMDWMIAISKNKKQI
jgi:23S rRNA U2552 (ribose-2'-O)-methylase RlmE/FtsJ